MPQSNSTLTLTGTEAGVGIDRIEVLSDNTCVPTGTGDNCTPSSDTTAPTVSLTAPASGSTVSGTTTINATASDNVAVANVQFKLDGANLGSADTASPYSFSWNTVGVSNGTHTLTAVATDTSNNTTTSSSVTVTVNNTTAPATVQNFAWNATTKTFSWTAYPGADAYKIAIVLNPSTTRNTSYVVPVNGISWSPTPVSGQTVNYGIIPQIKNSDGSYSDLTGATWVTEVPVTWPVTVTGDIDGDMTVTGHDLSILLSKYGTNYTQAEFDGSSTVEGHDLSILLSNYGK